MTVMVTLISIGGDLEEREEIVWSRLVLLEKNTNPCWTIISIIIILNVILILIGVNDEDDLYSCKAS